MQYLAAYTRNVSSFGVQNQSTVRVVNKNSGGCMKVVDRIDTKEKIIGIDNKHGLSKFTNLYQIDNFFRAYPQKRLVQTVVC